MSYNKNKRDNMTVEDYEQLQITEKLEQLQTSKFRSRFHLTDKEKKYIREKGRETIESHARDFIKKRLAPQQIDKDGKQTPMKGHPVFIAQHATATCCRGCLEKWHHIKKGKELTKVQQAYIVKIIMNWIDQQMKKQ